jgi:lysophospholipase L1-like esterase
MRARAFIRIVALGAASVGLCAGLPAAAEPERVMTIYVVGDAYSSGEGITGRGDPTGDFDPADPRRQSAEGAAVQAAARLRAVNPDVRVEVHLVASSGAATADVFEGQHRDDLTVNAPQLDQVPADADAVIIGLGGNDALLGPLLEAFVRDEWADVHRLRSESSLLLDNQLPDATYRDQARTSRNGRAPTLVARLLQVMTATRDKTGATLFFQNYPMALNPDQWLSTDVVGPNAMRTMRQLTTQVNEAIARSARICGCGTVVDVSDALHDRELNTADPAIEAAGTSEPLLLNREGAGLMADPIAEAWARAFGLTIPPRRGDRPTDLHDITITRGPAPDTDNDGLPDYKDRPVAPGTEHRKPPDTSTPAPPTEPKRQPPVTRQQAPPSTPTPPVRNTGTAQTPPPPPSPDDGARPPDNNNQGLTEQPDQPQPTGGYGWGTAEPTEPPPSTPTTPPPGYWWGTQDPAS